MRKLICYIILLILTLYIALIYKSDAFLLLFYGELLIESILIILNYASVKGIKIALQLPVRVASSEVAVPININISRSSRVPMGVVAVKVTCINNYTGKKKNIVLYGNEPVIQAQYTPEHTGHIEFKIKKVLVYDHMGMLSISVRQFDSHVDKILIVPELYDAPLYVDRRCECYISNDEDINYKSYDDQSEEVNDIRAYREGDRLRNIHWKLTSKMDDIMVRNEDILYSGTIVFFLLLDTKGHGKKSMAAVERFIQTIASLSQSIAKKNVVHYVSWYDSSEEDIIRYKIEDSDDVYGMLEAITEHDIFKKTQKNYELYELWEMYCQRYQVKDCSSYLSLDTSLNLTVKDEHITKYAAASLKESITNVEIVL